MASAASAGIIASNGFSPARDGFSFPNYGPGYANLSADQMRLLFGNSVCAFITKSGACALTPTAQTYMDNANMLMSSAGHCFGFSVLSMLIWRHEFPPLAHTPISRLRLRGDTALQRAIAYTFQWQMLPVVQNAGVKGTPNQELKFLTTTLRRGRELYTMTIFKPGFTGGHAITPYAVDSLGHGQYDVLVYDNNWPDQVRRVHFNTNTNSWSYVAAVNPSVPGSVYRGDARTGTLSLIPTTPGLGVHVCPFCTTPNGNPYPYTETWLQGNPYNHGHLLIRDDQGHEIGYDHGVFTRKFPGATAVFPTTAFTDLNQAPLPVYQIPFGISMHVTIDGFGLKYPDTERFTYLGQKRDVTIDRIQVRPGEKESIYLNYQEVSVTYVSAGSQITGPVMSYGLIKSAGDYTVSARALTLHHDSVIKFQDYQSTSTLAINDFSASGQTFEVQLTQPAPNGKVKQLGDFTVYQPPGKLIDVVYGQIHDGQPEIQIAP
jgi:hypothetical protein